MSRIQEFATATAMLLGFFSIGSQAAQVKPLESSRPNIILVMTDDQGMGDLSCMGNKVLRTPNIDRFYNQATRFTEFHVSPTCSPTRSAIMSGRYPFNVGVTHTILQRDRMALDVFTLPQALKAAGYDTGIFGKWHLGDEDAYLPGKRGFDEVLIHGSGGIGQVQYGDFPPNGEHPYFDPVLLHNDTIVQTKGFCTDVFFQAALGWIKKKEEAGSPYFCYLALNAPHAPSIAPEKYKKRFIDAGYDEKTAGRYGMIENIDDNFGALWSKLNEWNALENTLVIFMTDNGMAMPRINHNGVEEAPFNANLRGAKNSPFEGGNHVPAFWYWKDVLGKGVDIGALVAHIDLYKTFCELAGAKLPEKMQSMDGRSLLPLLKDPKTDWSDRELFVHCGRWDAGKVAEAKYQSCAVRTQQWRFVNNSMLFDVARDPSEKNDVGASNPSVVERLRKSYELWWPSTLPLMVNEGLPKINPENHPLSIRYYQQLKERGIPEWNPTLLKR